MTIKAFPFNDVEHPLRVPVSAIIQAELYQDDDALSHYRMDREHTEDLQVLALLLGKEVIATASVRTDTLSGPVSVLDNLAVAGLHQGYGYGAIILAAAEDYIVEHNPTDLKVSRLESTRIAIGFYEHMGYQRLAEDSEFMAKIIS